MRSSWLGRVSAGTVGACLLLAGGCSQIAPSHMQPLSSQAQYLLAEKGMSTRSPILIRIFKAESELEIWKQESNGTFHLFKSYPICRFSGVLGPKLREGDRQAPEGFYRVSHRQMNPRSREHLSFNIGYPNAYDRALGRTGSNIMVHGGCASIGCFAVKDEPVQDIFVLARDAFYGGQDSFQIQSYPFRMTAANMAKHRKNRWYDFWKTLKEGYDYFEATHREPKVDVCGKQYLINAEFDDPDAEIDPRKPCPAHHKRPLRQDDLLLASATGEVTGSVGEGRESYRWPAPSAWGSVLGMALKPNRQTAPMFTLGPAIPKDGE